ncbi:hypothetical protein HYT53_04890 [Candidatus Woesearchaeota archaeon]|nr:hypothetical protein [Candidatus Woesearchaeota archaeon]
MKNIVYLAMFILLTSFVYANDLSDFPEMFIEDGKLNAAIVVGNRAPSSDVIAQSSLVLFFGSETESQVQGASKLASEISSLNQSIISIGSPCHNNVSAQIMGYPQPCDNFAGNGKAVIRLFEYDKYNHIIVAGHTDKATREAVNVLVNYKKYGLDGNEYLVAVEEEPKQASGQKTEEGQENSQEQTKQTSMEEEKKMIIDELNKKISDKSKEKLKVNLESGIVENKSMQTGQQQAQNKEPSIINKIVNWVLSLFK